MKTTLAEGAARHFSAEAYARRKAAEKAAMDIMAETFDIENVTAAPLAIISGRLYLTKIGVCQGDPITKLLLRNNAAISAGTLFKIGLFRVTGDGTTHSATCLAVSADVTATFASAGAKNVPLTYVPSEDDMLYFGALFVGTTGPALYARLAGSLSGNTPGDGLTGLARGPFYQISAQTDIVLGQVYTPLVPDGNCAQLYAATRP